MAYSSHDLYEPELADYHRALLDDISNMADNYEEGLCPCPVLKPNFPSEVEMFLGVWSSMYWNGTEEEAYDEERPGEEAYAAPNHNWDWPSCFGDCQRVNFFSPDDDALDISVGKMVNFFHGEEQHENYLCFNEDKESQSDWDYNSWDAEIVEENAHDYGRQQSRIMYEDNLWDMGLCEGILGYWPCLRGGTTKISWSVEN